MCVVRKNLFEQYDMVFSSCVFLFLEIQEEQSSVCEGVSSEGMLYHLEWPVT